MILMPINTYSSFIALLKSKGGRLQYTERDSGYDLYFIEDQFAWNHNLLKDEGEDVQDFEANYKSTSNQPVYDWLDNGIKITATNRIPPGFTVYPTGRSDDISNGVFGVGDFLELFKTLTTSQLAVEFRWLEHLYAIGGGLNCQGADNDYYVDSYLVAPASQGFTNSSGDYDKYAVSGIGNMFIPNPGAGAWANSDLNAKFSNTNILKAVPVPSTGNNGFFDYNKDTNSLSLNAQQKGGFNLFDAEIKFHRFANAAWCSKQDGSMQQLILTDVVGKLLFNFWKIRFELDTVGVALSTNLKIKLMLFLATKKNVGTAV